MNKNWKQNFKKRPTPVYLSQVDRALDSFSDVQKTKMPRQMKCVNDK